MNCNEKCSNTHVAECNCPKVDCPNHGKCCDCVANHKAKGQLPFCLRPQQ